MKNLLSAQRKLMPTMVALVSCSCCSVMKAEADVPSARNVVCQPDYLLKDGRNFSAGKISAVHLPNSQKSVLISVLHVFGPDGGLDAPIPAQNLPGLLSKVTLRDLNTPEEEVIGQAGTELLSTGEAHAADGDDSKDLVAFELPSSYRRSILNLADKPATVGSRCWLLTYVQPNTAGEFPGVVAESSGTGMAFKPDQKIVTTATSGSPVVNASGEVIGILIGHDSKGLIWCNPGFRIRQRLQAEVRAR